MQTCLLTTDLISLLLSFIRYHIRGNITAHSQRKAFRFNSRTLRISAILNKENLATKHDTGCRLFNNNEICGLNLWIVSLAVVEEIGNQQLRQIWHLRIATSPAS